jgi:hypothetical protein
MRFGWIMPQQATKQWGITYKLGKSCEMLNGGKSNAIYKSRRQ